ncbi:MAG: hypothetical protein ACYS6W_18370 [Planctomycetota bacterium]|jgi:NMD protein affecting ribosome stability and mRNA decay
MDRWGPSEDCSECGQPESFGHLDEDGLCRECQKIKKPVVMWPDGAKTFNRECEE